MRGLPARPFSGCGRTLLLIALTAATLRGADDSVRVQDFSLADVHPLLSEGAVEVAGFSLVPMAYHEGLVQLHPKLMLGAAVDTNVYADNTDRVADEYFEALAGLQGQVEFSENERAYTDCEIQARDFRKEKDREALTARLYGQIEQDIANGSQLQETVAYVRADDPLIESGYEVDHGDALVGAQYAYEGLDQRVTLRGDYENSRFYTGDSFFAPHAWDYDDYRGTFIYGYRKGEFSEFIVRLTADEFHYVEEDQFQSSVGGTAIVGWRGALTPKIAGTVGGGLEVRTFDHAFANDPSYQDQRVARPVGAASVKWDLEEGSFLALRAFSELLPSEVANADWNYGLALSGRYRLLINAALTGGVILSHERESGAATGQQLEQRDNRSVTGGVEYYLREGVGTRLIASFDDSHSRDYNTFQRWVVRAELAFAY